MDEPEPNPAVSERTLDDLKKEHGIHLGSRFHEARGELAEQSPIRNYVRDLVLGFNDGLVSVYAVTAGVAGAATTVSFATSQILLTGIAASVAGSLSMAAGEYISTKSQAQFYASERAREEEHLTKWPHLEVQELRESLEAKGLEGQSLESAILSITSDRKKFLDYMMKEEFGVGQESERSPTRAALFVVLAFLLGSLFAILPYVWLNTRDALITSTLTSLLGLFLAGILRARASRLPAFQAGVEMAFIGALAGAITFFVGRLVGIAL